MNAATAATLAARSPMEYPSVEHSRRRHEPPQSVRPEGDKPSRRDYAQYKDYLRDEFRFTCVYCLRRETWGTGKAFFGVEHYQPKSGGGDERHAYANLVYACNPCNSVKGKKVLSADLHPETNPYARHLRIRTDGTIESLTTTGEILIEKLHLDRPDLNELRRKFYRLLEHHQERESEGDTGSLAILIEFFGWPADAPTLDGRPGAKDPYAKRGDLPEWF